ncbi:MvdC/MvdD family ATP grasp protein [Streptomyces klenkii]|uniref:MvdC/MvdD family ATP grasp protein n=1 Tax=Streptomyces klenkii TaxID=1420899 RepID=UPI00340C9F77
MTALVLTCPQDVTADMVIDHLNRAGVPVFRVDPEDFPRVVKLTAICRGSQIEGQIAYGTRTVDLQDIRSVWVRRPGPPGTGAAVQRKWVEHESTHAFYGVLQALRAVKWMNWLPSQRAASYKVAQLRWALDCGMTVPSTLVTNAAAAATHFAEGGPVVCKAVSGRQPDDPPMMLPTSPVPKGTDFSSAPLGPVCLQHRIPKVADVRLTVVGGTQFCAIADTGEVLDWRFEFEAEQAPWKPVVPPQPITEQVHDFMGHASLAYGALDFAVDAEGTWTFLECNPAGQFGFIELATQQPIAHTIAEWLT